MMIAPTLVLTAQDKWIDGRVWSRILVGTGSDSCPFGCSYCFARFTQYRKSDSFAALFTNFRDLPPADFLYPDCDGDLFASKSWFEVLGRLAGMPYSISLSTKDHLSTAQVEAALELQEHLRRRGKFLKIGVSFSTKNSVDDIEPKTPRYDLRLASLKQLAAFGIPTALVLRPLLPEVSTAEYREILVDAKEFTDYVLLGEEWLDSQDPRPLLGEARGLARIEPSRVRWLEGSPKWVKRGIQGRTAELSEIASMLGLKPFDSDLDLMASLASEYEVDDDHSVDP